MAVRNKNLTWHMQSGADVDDLTSGTGDLFKAIAFDDGDIAANGQEAGGILQYAAGSGEHITLAVSGISKFTAAAAIVAGARVTVTASGYMTTATSGSYIIGRNMDTAVASGAVGTGLFDFSVPRFAVNSHL